MVASATGGCCSLYRGPAEGGLGRIVLAIAGAKLDFQSFSSGPLCSIGLVEQNAATQHASAVQAR